MRSTIQTDVKEAGKVTCCTACVEEIRVGDRRKMKKEGFCGCGFVAISVTDISTVKCN